MHCGRPKAAAAEKKKKSAPKTNPLPTILLDEQDEKSAGLRERGR